MPSRQSPKGRKKRKQSQNNRLKNNVTDFIVYDVKSPLKPGYQAVLMANGDEGSEKMVAQFTNPPAPMPDHIMSNFDDNTRSSHFVG